MQESVDTSLQCTLIGHMRQIVFKTRSWCLILFLESDPIIPIYITHTLLLLNWVLLLIDIS